MTKTRRQIAELSDRIVREYRPEKVVLFGSHSRGTARSDSDVDLRCAIRANRPTGMRPVRRYACALTSALGSVRRSGCARLCADADLAMTERLEAVGREYSEFGAVPLKELEQRRRSFISIASSAVPIQGRRPAPDELHEILIRHFAESASRGL